MKKNIEALALRVGGGVVERHMATALRSCTRVGLPGTKTGDRVGFGDMCTTTLREMIRWVWFL